jgi:hypothetical protein
MDSNCRIVDSVRVSLIPQPYHAIGTNHLRDQIIPPNQKKMAEISEKKRMDAFVFLENHQISRKSFSFFHTLICFSLTTRKLKKNKNLPRAELRGTHQHVATCYS